MNIRTERLNNRSMNLQLGPFPLYNNRCFIKGFANIVAPLYDLTSGENKDKKSEHLDLPLEAREAFDRLKAACLQAPILAFPDFGKPLLLEMDASGKGLGAVLSQKQSDG